MKRTHILLIVLLSPAAIANPPQQKPDLAQLFLQQFDGNSDGKVDVDEFLLPSRKQFQAMDRDADGFVTGDEAVAFINQMRQGAKQAPQQ